MQPTRTSKRFLPFAIVVAVLLSPAWARAMGEADSIIAPLLPRLRFADRQVTAFRDVNVIPMDSARVVPHQTVIVNSSRIVTIGPASSTEIPLKATVIEGNGRYLIPGLADLHFHMPEPGLDWAEIDAYLLFFVANGITTVRSTQGLPAHPLIRQRVQRAEIFGPTLYLASPPIRSGDTRSPEAARLKIQQSRSDGFDFVKFLDIGDTTLWNAAVAACKETWLPCFGHVTSAIGLERALRSMRSIEHLGPYITSAGTAVPTLTADVAATRRAGVWNCPTQYFYEVSYERDMDRLEHAEGVSLMPDTLQREWIRREIEDIWASPGRRDRDSIEVAARRSVIRSLYQGGAGLLLGSDSPGRFRVPGYSLIEEMRAFRAAGIPPGAILAAATRNAAACLDHREDNGTIEIGKRADLVLLDANPLQDIENVRKRAGVMLRGAWYTSAELDKAARALAPLLEP